MASLTNLLDDPWIRVRRKSGDETKIRPFEMTDRLADDPIVDIVAPRPDFRSALYQFLIGLLQTTCMPEDDDDWLDWWQESPSPDTLAERMTPFRAAFMVAGEGPLFMQDRSACEAKRSPIGALLIDEPGVQSTKDNRDHFVKRSRISGLSSEFAVQALMTMQCMAPAGGAGNRTSLRGGGPLTTLLMPAVSAQNTLWNRAWLNVLDADAWPLVPGRQDKPAVDSAIFPWLGDVRSSEKGGVATTPEDAHALQHYWSMPRRIVLGVADSSHGSCPFSGESETMSEYRSRPWGPNYEGSWRHPLSPHYRTDVGDFLPYHPQPGGFSYRLWSEWAQPPFEEGPTSLCATTVSNHLLSPVRSNVNVRLWASGYDMDNMKPRCFYEKIWPLFNFSERCAAPARAIAEALAGMANLIASSTRFQIRDAWLRRAADHSDSKNNITAGIVAHFYDVSEPSFFAQLSLLHDCCMGASSERVDGMDWRNSLSRLALETFDSYVAIESIAEADPGRIARARNQLNRKMYGKKIEAHIDNISNAMDDIMQEGPRP